MLGRCQAEMLTGTMGPTHSHMVSAVIRARGLQAPYGASVRKPSLSSRAPIVVDEPCTVRTAARDWRPVASGPQFPGL